MSATTGQGPGTGRMRFDQALWPGFALAAVLAAGAFTLSFFALQAVAIASGFDARLSWMFPVVIDGFVILATWAAWRFRRDGLRGAWYPLAALVAFFGVSVVGNALHAAPRQVGELLLPNWAASAFSAVPAVALLGASHMLVLIATHKVRAVEPASVEQVATAARPTASPAPAAAAKPVVEDRAGQRSAAAPVAPARAATSSRPSVREPQGAPMRVGATPVRSAEARLGAVSGATVTSPSEVAEVRPYLRALPSTSAPPAAVGHHTGAPEGLEDLAAWVRARAGAGESTSAAAAAAAGMASSVSTAKRRLKELREQHPALFGVGAGSGAHP